MGPRSVRWPCGTGCHGSRVTTGKAKYQTGRIEALREVSSRPDESDPGFGGGRSAGV